MKTKKAGSKKAQATSARLAAVQALYQMQKNAQGAASAISEYMDFRLGRPVEGLDMVTADPELFSKIVSGVDERRQDLDHMIAATLGEKKAPEQLLAAIMQCGAWELLANGKVDAPIIISDYLHVTDAFFDQGEKKLVNAVLDAIARNVRDGS